MKLTYFELWKIAWCVAYNLYDTSYVIIWIAWILRICILIIWWWYICLVGGEECRLHLFLWYILIQTFFNRVYDYIVYWDSHYMRFSIELRFKRVHRESIATVSPSQYIQRMYSNIKNVLWIVYYTMCNTMY